MGKQLVNMTWDNVKEEMSIAGSPDKITQLGSKIMTLIEEEIDWTNRAEMTNIEFAIKRINAEIKANQRRYDKSHR